MCPQELLVHVAACAQDIDRTLHISFIDTAFGAQRDTATQQRELPLQQHRVDRVVRAFPRNARCRMGLDDEGRQGERAQANRGCIAYSQTAGHAKGRAAAVEVRVCHSLGRAGAIVTRTPVLSWW